MIRIRFQYCLTTALVLLGGLTQAATINLATKLQPVSGEAASFDRMGQAVAVSGDTAVVGAYLAAEGAVSDAGTAYVFKRDFASSWGRQQKIIHPSPATNDLFGNAVAISDNTIAVAAVLDDEGAATDSGAVYIFTRSGVTWTLQQRIVANDPSSNGGFGRAVALEGNTLLVGANRANGGTGAAYVFTRSGSTWTQAQRLVATDAAANDFFGAAVAISGDRLVVGAERANVGSTVDAGAAYAFRRSGAGVWSQQTKLVPSTFSQDDNFGLSVAINGSTIAVGQPFLGTGPTDNKGAVIVFDEQSGNWVRVATLVAADGAANDFFGRSVGISGDSILVGAYFDDNGTTQVPLVNAGSTYHFTRTSGTWSETDKLLGSDTVLNDLMGSSVAISGSAAIIGAPFDNSGSLLEAGTAFSFTRDNITVTAVSLAQAVFGYGENITLSAKVSASTFSAAPIGNIEFFRGTTSLGLGIVNANGEASLLVASPGAGEFNITARYNGDANHLASISPIRALTVNRAVTNVSLTAPTASTVPYGTNLTYTANLSVVGGLPLPSGNVRFVDGTTTIGTATLSAGVATLNINSLAVGGHSVLAQYDGDANYESFTTTAAPITVSRASVVITLTTTPSPSLEGNSIGVVATMTGGIPVGKSIGFEMVSPTSVILGSVSTNASGVATINTGALALGAYQFRAVYFGDTNHFPASDDSGLHNVLAAANLTITKTNNQAFVQSGGLTTYTIAVTNNGPNAVTGATVVDNIDDDLVTGLFEPNAPWTCAASGGASCSGGASGSGDINLAVDLPVGGVITVEVQAQSRADAEPFVSNTAVVVLPATMGDPNTSDNASTDSDPSGMFVDSFETSAQ